MAYKIKQAGKCTVDTDKPFWVYAVDNYKGQMFWGNTPDEALLDFKQNETT